MSKKLTAIFNVSGAEYTERDYAVVNLDEEAMRHILKRMDQVKELGVFSITEYAGGEIDFVSGVEFDSEEDETVFGHDCKIINPQEAFAVNVDDMAASLDLERMQAYDTMVCWTAYLKHGDPPTEIEAGPLYREDIEEALGIVVRTAQD